MRYSEHRKRDTINWQMELHNPPEYGSHNHERLTRLSSCWVTCACGQQCHIIPRDSMGNPEDDELRELGQDFAMAVRFGNWEIARNVLHNIETRSHTLLREIGDTGLV